MAVKTVKQQAQDLVNRLPNEATWDELKYQIYVRQNVAKGMNDCETNRVMDVADVRNRFGLDS